MAADFPFTMKDIAYLLNLRIRHKNAVCLDVNCPFCGETKGKMNLNLKKNVFKCNRCGETGGMLALYGKVYQVDNQTAYKEIMAALGENRKLPVQGMKPKAAKADETEIINAPAASAEIKDKTYTMLFSMLCLSDTHRKNLLQRGFTEEQHASFWISETDEKTVGCRLHSGRSTWFLSGQGWGVDHSFSPQIFRLYDTSPKYRRADCSGADSSGSALRRKKIYVAFQH